MSEIQRGDYIQLFNLGCPVQVACVMFIAPGESAVGLEDGNLHHSDFVRRVARIRIKSIKYKPKPGAGWNTFMSHVRVVLPTWDDTTYWPGR